MTTTGAHQRRSYRQPCPVAHALDIVGERWTLLIVRDLMFGPLRFTDLRAGLPGLAPNLLSDRLQFLVDRGILEQIEMSNPTRVAYALTQRGRQLSPVVHELARFGVAEWADPDDDPPPPRLERGALLSLMSPERLGPSGWTALLVLPKSSTSLAVAGRGEHSPLERLRLHPAEAGVVHDLVVTTTLGTLTRLRRGELTLTEAERDGLRVEGQPEARRELALLLGWPARSLPGPPTGT
ncbi:MAG: helix-turn-helix domain-containing protein [Microthrixaceae bacterium]